MRKTTMLKYLIFKCVNISNLRKPLKNVQNITVLIYKTLNFKNRFRDKSSNVIMSSELSSPPSEE